MLEMLIEWFGKFNTSPEQADMAARSVLVLALLLLAALAWIIARGVLLRVVRGAVKRTETKWDDRLLEKKLFGRAAHLAPAVVIYLLAGVPMAGHARAIAMTQSAANIYMLIVGALAVSALLNGAHAIYRSYDVSQRIPIRGFLQVIKGVLFFVVGIFVLSILMNESPKFFLGGLGALTAVLMLVFKDPILGLVGGIQLSTNDMVRIGDWISMPKYQADGDVIEISLTTVKVQNWDKTITTIPTYALIADSMKNWRGMSDSGGRRICRSIHLDLNTVRFCTPEMLERFGKIEFIQEYLETKAEEVASYNAEHGVDDSVEVNGRRLTNIGTFRAYISAYLHHHTQVHEDMTFLVRQLPPGPTGVPIQIYVFTKTTVWVEYEGIQSDIFDHLLAAVPEFDMRVFQEPTDAELHVRITVPDGVEARVTNS